MVRDVRIVVVGDEGVGKSTIISSLIKEEFVQLVPHSKLPEVTIPSTFNSIIIDTCSTPAHRSHLITELNRASVVVIIFSIDNPNSFERILSYWLPTIRSLGLNVPVVLVANKIDLRLATSGVEAGEEGLSREMKPIMMEFKEVETSVECSAKLGINIPEVFYFAQNAVLHPTAPLYDSRQHTLKPACITALTRIFKISDENKDGLLSDQELSQFQSQCFSSPLQLHELNGIKSLVAEALPSGEFDAEGVLLEEGIKEDSLTLAGFLWLQCHFIQLGRLETTWKVLRTFGYGEDLMLREEIIFPKFDIPVDSTAELSPKGYQFFIDIFKVFDKDNDGALSTFEFNNLFSTCPSNPWMEENLIGDSTNELGASGRVIGMTLQTFLAQWSMTTLLTPKITLSYLAYLGYSPSQNPITALRTSLPKKYELKKKGASSKNVFLGYCLGANGSGKSSVLRHFGGGDFLAEGSGRGGRGKEGRRVVGVVESGGEQKYLVLQEFEPNYEGEILRSSKKLALADILIFFYDSSDTNSFSYISNLRVQYKLDELPCIFVATKSDLDLAQQRHEVQPDTYCRKLDLSVPLAVSIKTNQINELFERILKICIRPGMSIPNRTKKPIFFNNNFFAFAFFGGVVGVGFFAWKQLLSRS